MCIISRPYDINTSPALFDYKEREQKITDFISR
jgi:hypothetical protein